jgi:hypothetical protein
MKFTYRDRAPLGTVPPSNPSDGPSVVPHCTPESCSKDIATLVTHESISPSILIINEVKVLPELLLQESLHLIIHGVFDTVSAETFNSQSFQSLDA